MQFGLKTPQQGMGFQELREIWLAADQIGGIDDLWLYDHFLSQPGPSHEMAHEAWATLAALASVTSRVGVGILVSSVTHRPPASLLAAAATVDEIAGGRLRLGLGAGWSEDEHRLLGLPFPPPVERLAMLDETCLAFRRLFRGETVSAMGKHVRLGGVRLRSGRDSVPPLVIGGTGRRMLELVARHADVWNVAGIDALSWRVRHKDLVRACAAIGRPMADIAVSVQVAARLDDIDRTVQVCGYLARTGVNHLVLELDRLARGSEVETLVGAVRDEVSRF